VLALFGAEVDDGVEEGQVEAPDLDAGGALECVGCSGVMMGSMVERASGRRRVRKSWAAWRYAFAICDDCWREADRDEMDEER
jgi:hypothetical protein